MMDRKHLTTLALMAGLLSSSSSAGAFEGSDAQFADSINAVRAQIEEGVRQSAQDEGLQAAELVADPQSASETTLVADNTTTLDVSLNSLTVKCSQADYSMPMLKVLIPALADITVLNHRNVGEGAPCVAAGPCATMGPKRILDAGEGVDRIPVRVTLEKQTTINGNTCRVGLIETVTLDIRGVPFFHKRWQKVADRTAEDCR